MINPWKILGVHRKSNDADIRDAYYNLARKYHPDMKTPDAAKFHEAAEAYLILKTKENTRDYLAKISYALKDCHECAAQGYKAKTRGLTSKTYVACTVCGGAGVIFKEKENEQRTIELRGASGTGRKRRDPKR